MCTCTDLLIVRSAFNIKLQFIIKLRGSPASTISSNTLQTAHTDRITNDRTQREFVPSLTLQGRTWVFPSRSLVQATRCRYALTKLTLTHCKTIQMAHVSSIRYKKLNFKCTLKNFLYFNYCGFYTILLSSGILVWNTNVVTFVRMLRSTYFQMLPSIGCFIVSRHSFRNIFSSVIYYPNLFIWQ